MGKRCNEKKEPALVTFFFSFFFFSVVVMTATLANMCTFTRCYEINRYPVSSTNRSAHFLLEVLFFSIAILPTYNVIGSILLLFTYLDMACYATLSQLNAGVPHMTK
jgi:hypothetical protein